METTRQLRSRSIAFDRSFVSTSQALPPAATSTSWSDENGKAGRSSTRNTGLASFHHRAFDQDLVGIDPGYTVRVAPGMLEEEDGPMLELLKGFNARPIALPRAPRHRPNQERLAERFDRFLERAR